MCARDAPRPPRRRRAALVVVALCLVRRSWPRRPRGYAWQETSAGEPKPGPLSAVGHRDPAGVALDAAPPGQFAEAVAAAGPLPVLRPL